MKVEINVEGSQLDSEVKELLASLTPDQKREMAADILAKTLMSTESSLQMSIARQKALTKVNEIFNTKYTLGSRNELSNYPSYDHTRKFHELVKEYGDVAAYFKEVILAEILKQAQEMVKNTVEQSVVVKDALEQTKTELQNMLPKIVHDAMVVYFTSQMTSLMNTVAGNVFQTKANTELLSDLQNKIENSF
jgi:hypothetical protein